MAEPARALLALWNDVDPAMDAEYEAWHGQEHVPERLTVPGMVWARRYAADDAAGPRYLTIYGLVDLGVLASAPYQRLLDHPTPWSRRMRPALRNVSRWACELRIERGAADWQALHTLGFDAVPVEAEARLRDASAGGFVAQRSESAKPLPWLAGAQAHEVTGSVLIGVDGGAAADAGRGLDFGAAPRWVRRFRRLPQAD